MQSKTRTWTEKQRKRQAEICRINRPSKHSTGAKTKAGKHKSAQNALKHGFFAHDMERLKSLMREQKRFLEMIY